MEFIVRLPAAVHVIEDLLQLIVVVLFVPVHTSIVRLAGRRSRLEDNAGHMHAKRQIQTPNTNLHTYYITHACSALLFPGCPAKLALQFIHVVL